MNIYISMPCVVTLMHAHPAHTHTHTHTQHGRFLRLDHVEDARFGSNYLVNLSWSAPCSATGLYPACVVSCTDAVQPICSPPACFRMEVCVCVVCVLCAVCV